MHWHCPRPLTACRCLRRPEATGPYRGHSLPRDTEASWAGPQLRPSQRERNESEAGRPALRRAGSALASSPKSQASGKMPSGRQGWSEPEEVQAPATKASHGGRLRGYTGVPVAETPALEAGDGQSLSLDLQSCGHRRLLLAQPSSRGVALCGPERTRQPSSARRPGAVPHYSPSRAKLCL